MDYRYNDKNKNWAPQPFTTVVCTVCMVRASDRFGRDYFDKLSAGGTKHMFAEDLPDGVGSNQHDSNDELGVITLAGVNKVE